MKRHAQSPKVVTLMARCAALAAIIAACIGGGAFTASAGSLTPPGPPGPTIQQKPTWDKTIPVAQRFVDALDKNSSGAYEAVLDKETGLVWAKSPYTVSLMWDQADLYCATLNLGGRKGWRLPTIAELSSLIDMSNPGIPKLPVGQTMFTNVPADTYASSAFWSSSSSAGSSNAWTVNMGNVFVYGSGKTNSYYVWPVRGGQ
jgi:hypothetical protein